MREQLNKTSSNSEPSRNNFLAFDLFEPFKNRIRVPLVRRLYLQKDKKMYVPKDVIDQCKLPFDTHEKFYFHCYLGKDVHEGTVLIFFSKKPFKNKSFAVSRIYHTKTRNVRAFSLNLIALYTRLNLMAIKSCSYDYKVISSGVAFSINEPIYGKNNNSL